MPSQGEKPYGMDPDDFVLAGASFVNIFAFITTMSIFWWYRKARGDFTVYQHKKDEINLKERQAFYQSSFSVKENG